MIPGRRSSLLLILLTSAACGPVALAGPGCRTLDTRPLPPELRESSGVAVSLTHPGIFWTHNDAGSVLYALDREARIVARLPLDRTVRDWEDLSVAPCGEGRSCIYIADLGDNYEERDRYGPPIAILRAPEPDPSSLAPGDTLRTQVFPVRLPEGARDIEALLVFPGERIYAVTKGRNHPVTVYRYPPPLRPDTVTLQEVQRLTTRARILPRQVTGGAVSPRGTAAALRTYEALQFYALTADTLAAVPDGLVNLRTLQEPQGEGVSIGLDGLVVLTSEGGPAGARGQISFLSCTLPDLPL